MKMQGRIEGFTLVELLFSMALFSMAVVFFYSTFVANTRMYRVENRVVELQQSTRTATDEVNRNLYMAGSGVPQGAVPSDIGFLYAVSPGYGGPDWPDTVTFLRGYSEVQAFLSASMPDESAELKVEDASMFTPGDVVIIQGGTQDCGESVELFQITQISLDGQNMLQHNPSGPWNEDERLNCMYLPPSTITKVEFIRYYVDSSDPEHPCLVRRLNEQSTEIIAMDIENLKVAYDLLSGERGVSDPTDPNLIRKVNFTMIGRTSEEDRRWSGGVHSLTGESDGYRRYRLLTHVFIRNIES